MRYMREVEINWEIWFSSSGKHSIFTALGAEKCVETRISLNLLSMFLRGRIIIKSKSRKLTFKTHVPHTVF